MTRVLINKVVVYDSMLSIPSLVVNDFFSRLCVSTIIISE